MVTLLLLGIACWFGTLLVVESEFFRPVRRWIDDRETAAQRLLTAWFWSRAAYMINCQMCAGMWVGLALAPFAPMIFGPGILQFLVVAVMIKGIGHFFLVVHKYLEELTNHHKAQRALDLRAALMKKKDVPSDLGGQPPGASEEDGATAARWRPHR